MRQKRKWSTLRRVEKLQAQQGDDDNVNSQDLQQQVNGQHDTGSQNEDITTSPLSSERLNSPSSSSKLSTLRRVEKLQGQQGDDNNVNSQDLQQQVNGQHGTGSQNEDITTSPLSSECLKSPSRSRKLSTVRRLRSSRLATLRRVEKLQGQQGDDDNANSQDLQRQVNGQNDAGSQNEDITTATLSGERLNSPSSSSKLSTPRRVEKLQGQLGDGDNINSQDLQQQINGQHDAGSQNEDITTSLLSSEHFNSPSSSSKLSTLRRLRSSKLSTLRRVEKLQGQQGDDDNVNSEDLQQQVNGQHDAGSQNEDITTSPLNSEHLKSPSSSNETHSQKIEKLSRVKIVDTYTREITTRKIQPDQVWDLEENVKVIVELNGDGQGTDNGSNLLVRFLGKLCQKSAFCPISFERWDKMPESYSCKQWRIIEEKFEFDYVAGVKWVMRTLGDRWRIHKYRLRRDYISPNKSEEEILANAPSGVSSTDWAAFVHHYVDKKMKEQSAQNRRNREKVKVSHSGGSKSNARRAREMEEKLGRPVCRSEVVLSTLIKQDGNYVNQEKKILADKLSEHLPQDQERAATLGVPSKIFAHPNDGIAKVRGAEHSGGAGAVVVGHSTSYNSSQQRIDDLEKQVETLTEKLTGYDDTKEKLVKTNEQLAHTSNQLATLHNFLQAKFGSELPTFNQSSL